MCICICIRSFELWKSWKEWVLKPEHKWALNSRYWGNEWCCMRWPCCPTDKTAHYSPRSFAVAGPTTWNSLPASLHDKQLSVTSFRCLLETHLFRRAYVGTPWACSWLFPVRAGEHKLLDLDLDLVFHHHHHYHHLRLIISWHAQLIIYKMSEILPANYMLNLWRPLAIALLYL